MEVVWCFFDCTVKGVKEGGVERPEREFGNDMGEVKCCTDDQISWTSGCRREETYHHGPNGVQTLHTHDHEL